MERSVAPTFIDLFAGAGLFSAGMMQAGFEPALAVELDQEAVASYRRNVSPCAVRGSVTEPREIPQVDVVIAGPPCQGFSTLGRRDPTDVRNDLSLSILPWIEAASPSLVVVENVPPFLRSTQWRRLARRLKALGYRSVDTWELDAAGFRHTPTPPPCVHRRVEDRAHRPADAAGHFDRRRRRVPGPDRHRRPDA